MFKRIKLSKKSTFEDAIQHYLDGEQRDSALEFAAWAKENELTPKKDGKNPAKWSFPYKDVCLGWVHFEPDYRFFFWFCDYSGQHDEGFIKAVHERVRFCTTCHGGPCSGGDATIFGKEFKNACQEHTVQFVNPDSTALEYIKQMFEYWKEKGHTSVSYHYLNG